MKWNLSLLIFIGHCYLMSFQLYKYHYIKEEKSCSDAQQYCRDRYTDLATLSNLTDMKKILRNSTENMQDAWIGLNNPTEGFRARNWSLKFGEFNDSEIIFNKLEGRYVEDLWICLKLLRYFRHREISSKRGYSNLCYDGRTAKGFSFIKPNGTFQAAWTYCRGIRANLSDELYRIDKWFRNVWRLSELQFYNHNYNYGECVLAVFDDGYECKYEDCAVRKPFICYDATSPTDKMILIKEKMNWNNALRYCRKHHYDLINITNLEEQRWVEEKAKNASTEFVWIGLRYNCAGNFWYWVCPGVNTCKILECNECNTSVAINSGGQHQWFQKDDTEEFNFICSTI